MQASLRQDEAIERIATPTLLERLAGDGGGGRIEDLKRGGAEPAEISMIEGRDGVGVEIGHLVCDHSFNQFL